MLLSRGENLFESCPSARPIQQGMCSSGHVSEGVTRLHEDRQSGDYDFVAGVSESEARQDVMDAHRRRGRIKDLSLVRKGPENER